MNTQKLCNGDVCWPQAWNKVGPCEGANTPTFDTASVSLSGCPEKYETGNAYKYKEGDEVSVTLAGEGYGKIYKCKAWPESEFKFICAKNEPIPSMICFEGSVASGKCTTEGQLDGCGRRKKCWWNEECPGGDVRNCSTRGASCS